MHCFQNLASKLFFKLSQQGWHYHVVNTHDPLKAPFYKKKKSVSKESCLWGLPTSHLSDELRELFWKHWEGQLLAIHSRLTMCQARCWIQSNGKDTEGSYPPELPFYQRESEHFHMSKQIPNIKKTQQCSPRRGPGFLRLSQLGLHLQGAQPS